MAVTCTVELRRLLPVLEPVLVWEMFTQPKSSEGTAAATWALPDNTTAKILRSSRWHPEAPARS